MNSIIPYLHVFFFLSLFIYYILKNKSSDYSLVLVVIGVYLFSSLAGLVHYYADVSKYKDLTLIASLYYFLLFGVAIIPIARYDVSKIKNYQINNNVILYICILLLVTSLIPFIESLFKIKTFFSASDLSGYVTDMHNDRQQGDKEQKVVLSLISVQLMRFSIWFIDFIPIMLFYLLVKFRKFNIYIASLTIAQLLIMLNAMLSGGRSVFVHVIIYYVFIYFVFSRQFSPLVKKKIHRLFFVIGGLSVTFLLLITVWRFKNSSVNSGDSSMSKGVVEWLALYAGEGMLNFNEYVWNAEAVTKGDRTMPLFKTVTGMDTFTENFERRTYWQPKTGIPENIFYTSIGNFIQDFGKIIGGLVIILLSIGISNAIKKNKMKKMYNVFLIAIYYKYLALGIFFFPYGGMNGGMLLVKSSLIVVTLYVIDRIYAKNIPKKIS